MIEQYEKDSENQITQLLEARCTLVYFYQRLDEPVKITDALEKAREALEIALAAKEKSETLFAACTKVGRAHIDTSHFETAEDIFEKVGSEAEDALGLEHDATIRLLICIGVIYQGRNLWKDAQPWFERAYAASIVMDGLLGTRTQRLEAALENQHYSTTSLSQESLESIFNHTSRNMQSRIVYSLEL
jgi:tetratricopeptide (TPR) repeat protein